MNIIDKIKKDGFANNKMRTAAQTAFLMAILTLVSKLLGFIREMIMAGLFGASYITDAYVMAQSIPNILFAGIFGAVATAYMPIFSKHTEGESNDAGIRFTNKTLNLLLCVSIISSLIGIAFSDQLVSVFAAGFRGETFELTSLFVKITFSYVIFTSTSEILEAFLRYKNIFLLPIATGYLQNIIVIVVIIVSAYYNYSFLAFGLLFAYIVRLIILSKASAGKGLNYSFTFKFGDAAKRIVALSLPVFLGSSIYQINIFVDKTLASRLVEGSVSALNYGYLLIGLITGMTTMIIIKILYPRMTQAVSLGDFENFNRILSTALNIVCIIIIPATFGAMIYSNEIVQIVYERGAFDQAATSLTDNAFFYYSIGMLFYVLNGFLTDTYYSMHDMKTPVKFALIGVTVNIILNLILVRYMELSGLALATSIAAFCNVILLYFGIKRKYRSVIIIRSKVYLVCITFSAIVSVGLSYIAFLLMNHLMTHLLVRLMIAVLIACIIYLLMLKLFKIRELEFLKQLIKF